MTTTTRRKKTTVTAGETMPATHTTVTISDICKAENVTEQAFRFALSELRPDDFDTVKAIPEAQKDMVLATLASAAKVLPSQDTTPQLPESPTPQAIQTAPETAQNQPQKQQNSDIVASTSKAPVTQGQAPKTNLPTALDELIASAEDDINLADLVLVYRNQQISQNTQTRDSELVAQLRERRIERRNQVFDSLRDLNSRQPQSPELPELPQALTAEIDALSRELGKQLVL